MSIPSYFRTPQCADSAPHHPSSAKLMQEQWGIWRTRHSQCHTAKRRKPLSGHFGLPGACSTSACSTMQLASADKLVEGTRNIKIAFCFTPGLPVIPFSLSQAAAGYAALCSFKSHFLLILSWGPQFRHTLHLQDEQKAGHRFSPAQPSSLRDA